MQPADLNFLIELLYKRSGLSLTADKQYLLDSRLTPIARANGCGNLSELVRLLRQSPSESLLVEITEAMTTNESSFFRDGKPFEHLKQTILPQLRESITARKNMRIWSAACSTGQEPYSIAITLQEEEAKAPGWRYEITATDLAQKVLNKAKEGIYTQFEAQRGMPIQLLLKYFTQVQDTGWQVKENVRNMINFKQHNLLDSPPLAGTFDIILCRNVLIYFDEQTKSDAIDRLAKSLSPTGYLIIGSTESLTDNNQQLTQCEGLRGIYQLKDNNAGVSAHSALG
jgi:chemotaxis protein methyltransferase CheR